MTLIQIPKLQEKWYECFSYTDIQDGSQSHSLALFLVYSFLNDFWPMLNHGILKGEVSLHRCPPVWLDWNQLYDKL